MPPGANTANMALLVAMALLAHARLGQSESVSQSESMAQAATGLMQAKFKQQWVDPVAEDPQGPQGAEAADGEQRASEQAESQQHAAASALSLPHGLDFALKKLAQLEAAVRQHARQLSEKDAEVRELRAELRRHAAAEPHAAHSAQAEPDGREERQPPAMAEQAAEAPAEMAQALLAEVARKHGEQLRGKWRTAAEPNVDAARAQEATTVALLETSLPACMVFRPEVTNELISFGKIVCRDPNVDFGVQIRWPTAIKDAIEFGESLMKHDLVKSFVGPIAGMVDGMLGQSASLLQEAGAATFPSPEEGERVHHSSKRMTVKTSTKRRPAGKASLAQTGERSAGDDGGEEPKSIGGIGIEWSDGGYAQTELMTQFGGKEKFTGSCLSFAPKKRTGPDGKVLERDWQAPNQHAAGNSLKTTTDFVALEPWAVPCGNGFMRQHASDWEGFTMINKPSAIEKCVSLGINFNMEPSLAVGPGVTIGLLPDLLAASVQICWPAGSLCPPGGRSGILSQISFFLSALDTPVFEFHARDTSVARSNTDHDAWEVAVDTFLGSALGESVEGMGGDVVESLDRDASLVQNGTHEEAAVRRLLHLADGDGDDALSPQELARAGLPPADADDELLGAFAARFEAADGDADGRLRPDELLSLLRPPAPDKEPGELVVDESKLSMATVNIGREGSTSVSERVRGAAAARRMRRQFAGNASRAGALLEEDAEAQSHRLFTLDLPGPFTLNADAAVRDAKVVLEMGFGMGPFVGARNSITLLDLKAFLNVLGKAMPCAGDISGTVESSLNDADRAEADAQQKERAAMDARTVPSGYTKLGAGHCQSGYYAGWVAADATSIETCARKCSAESSCRFFSLKLGKSCSRYTSAAGSCTDRPWGQNDHITYAKNR